MTTFNLKRKIDNREIILLLKTKTDADAAFITISHFYCNIHDDSSVMTKLDTDNNDDNNRNDNDDDMTTIVTAMTVQFSFFSVVETRYCQ